MKMHLLLLVHGGLQFSLVLAAASEAAKLIFWGGLFYCIKNDMDILLSGQRYFVDVFFDDTISHLE